MKTIIGLLLLASNQVQPFTVSFQIRTNSVLHLSPPGQGDSFDSNRWISSDDDDDDKTTSSNAANAAGNVDLDWEAQVKKRQDGSLWSSFESGDDGTVLTDQVDDTLLDNEDDDGENWLNTIAAISSDEIEFINTEADRADKARQMQEWGFTGDSIASTLGVATDETLERDPENEVLEKFKEETAKTGFGMYLDDEEDLELIESHNKVEKDGEGEPIRTQMVYVDEVSCIGCTNCAMVAQSTFFMEAENGRARVFNQWGDDDETIAIAIETCPVDCIHYVPYDELVRLEVERRDQLINFKARLVSQAEYGGGQGHKVGGAEFTPPQLISGNLGSRCNNCPSRGCKNCPMYGVGKNPYFEQKEKERKEKAARRRMKEKMENSDRSAEL